jgi:regulator of sirC expression with transglutaminase-like and TPR domain
VIDLILCINPGSLDERRDRGLVYYRLECFQAALDDLKEYLANSAGSEKEIRQLVLALEKRAPLLH